MLPTSGFTANELAATWSAEVDIAPALMALRTQRGEPKRCVFVVDDDPTGVQSLTDSEILTAWEPDLLEQAWQAQPDLLYILGNTRALPEAQAVAVCSEIVQRVKTLAEKHRVSLCPISRSDSTLRGHYPAELRPFEELFSQPPDGHIIAPAYPDAGRIVLGARHFVFDHAQQRFVPVTETDFSRDPTFGFRSADLPLWVEEKSNGSIRASDVVTIGLSELRSGGVLDVAHHLQLVANNAPVVADAVGYGDLFILAAAARLAERHGKRFVYRTAAPFVRAMLGIPPSEKDDSERGVDGLGPGLVLVGSYVKLSTAQLRLAQTLPTVESIELPVAELLEADTAQRIVERICSRVDSVLRASKTALVFTSRELLSQTSTLKHLEIGERISAALVSIPGKLERLPRWVLAKGGITSHEVLTTGLGAKQARVVGHPATGVSLLELGTDSRAPGLYYVVFPGNVGGPGTLAEVIERLQGQT
jgi:uncharacterized protein YgbK (DUF1537 family)